ncbi:MAG: phospholipase D-like domain-containing protein [Reichenbachiella sp.]|uniref:phospholipase D-like domain-containing protein n=1 Tax=Reichenbachiella sp. TaxID=2184521 RepID=UPI003265B89E
MIKFLETEEISACIKRIIENATDTIYIVSPYLSIRRKLRSYFEEAINRNVKIVFVYRKLNYANDDINWLTKLGSKITQIENKNLHAKCYINDSEAIVTSMNLYGYSQDNNYEMGVLIDKKDDMFDKVQKSVETIIKHSTQSIDTERDSGFCIRCRSNIDRDSNKPYCYSCYLIWYEYENYNYQENCCHNCGEKESTSISRPLCYDCFKAS